MKSRRPFKQMMKKIIKDSEGEVAAVTAKFISANRLETTGGGPFDGGEHILLQVRVLNKETGKYEGVRSIIFEELPSEIIERFFEINFEKPIRVPFTGHKENDDKP